MSVTWSVLPKPDLEEDLNDTSMEGLNFFSKSIQRGCFGNLLGNYVDEYYFHGVEGVRALRTKHLSKVRVHRNPDDPKPTSKHYQRLFSDVKTLKDMFPDIFMCMEINDGSHEAPYTFDYDLSYPRDTVWFCMNLTRLIMRTGYSSNIHYDMLRDIFDVWQSSILAFGIQFSRGMGETLYKPYNSSNNQWSTCLWTPRTNTLEEMVSFYTNPIKHLNKSTSTIDRGGLQPVLKSNGTVSFIYLMFESKYTLADKTISEHTFKNMLDAINPTKEQLEKLSLVVNLENTNV